MYRGVSNNTKIAPFHSVAHKSIILHCWLATGCVSPSATETHVMPRDAITGSSCHPQAHVTLTADTRVFPSQDWIFTRLLSTQLYLPMWVYRCKSLLTSQEGSHLCCKQCWGPTPALPPVPELSPLSPSHCNIQGNTFSQSLITADKETSQTKTWRFTTRSPHQNILCIS